MKYAVEMDSDGMTCIQSFKKFGLDIQNTINSFCLFVCLVYRLLCCIAPQCNYLHVRCAVSVIGLTAVDSARK
jgi:hypothetical protein